MRTTTFKRVPIAIAAVLIIVMVLTMGFTVTSGVTYAANGTIVALDEISVGHLSDIHYFPLRYCYTTDVDSDEYKQTDFYHSMTGDTKLVLESGTVLNSTIRQIINDGREGTAPTYLVASGDLSKNGERGALIDVANTLRYLQNEMRSLGGKYANFQVFAMVGNHDLYNHNGAFYSKEDGHSVPADMVTAMQFAMIFAGLGFPNATLDGKNNTFNLTEYMPEEYWYSSYTTEYIESKNADNLNISYYSAALQALGSGSTQLSEYLAIGDGLNQLTYFAEVTDKQGYSFAIIDSTDRETTEEGSPVRISEAEYDALVAKGEAPKLYLDDGNGVINFKKAVTKKAAFETNTDKNVYRRTPVRHITGGRITVECLDWVAEQAAAQNATAPNGEETIISSFHHNVLPHFEQEDDILKDFTLYNWEYTAKRMLEMGIRYALTGHMHASDAMSYTDVQGRTLYDFETGSIISYASPRRYVSFARKDCDGKLGEVVTSSVNVLKNIKEVASDNITTAAAWDQNAYDAAMTAYKANPTDANLAAVLASNEDYLVYIIRYDEFAKLADENNYNDFISKDIYTIIVDRMVDHFITQSTVDGLVDTVISAMDNALSGELFHRLVLALGINSDVLDGVVSYLFDTALFKLYGENGDYPFNGDTYPTAVEYVRAIINDFLNLEYGNADVASTVNPENAGMLNVKELASFIMMSHSAGMEISLDETVESITRDYGEIACGEDHYRFKQPSDRTYRIRMLYALKDFNEQMRSGKVVDDLLSALLDPLFNNDDALLKTLLDYKFDFSKAVEEGYMTQEQFESWEYALGTKLSEPFVKSLINEIVAPMLGTSLPDDFTISFDATNVSLGEIINKVLPLVKPLLGDLIGFNMDGDDVVSILENALDSYVTPSFLVGLGGIAGDIVMAFATDVYPDIENSTDPSVPHVLQPYADYKYAGQKVTYVSTNNVASAVGATFNAATQENGRVPSRVTANFDTVDNTTAFTVKFYTEENIYGTFRYKTSVDGEWITVSTTAAGRDMTKDYIDSTASKTTNGVTVEMLTQTKPVYLPLIDLGLLCLTHAEVETDDGVLFKYGDRDSAEKNSVVYWNVTTVTVSGLSADTTYYYDLAGNCEVNGEMQYFSFVDFNKTQGYDKDYFTFTTAKGNSQTAFEFLTIADIQGMIQGMYTDSYSAINALLGDERTKDFDFILNAGDMCDNGKNFNQWALALDTYQTVFANTSTFFAAGNHENGSSAMVNFFNYTLPTDADGNPLQEYTAKKDKDSLRNGEYYSFNYANAHFVVLNTNDASSNGLGETQYNWLVNDLETSNAKWKFVLMHKSLYSGGSHSTDSEVIAMRNQLIPLFANTGVSIVFGGHDHTYTSTTLIDNDGKAHDRSNLDGVQYTGDGVLYITLGTMGTKYYTYKDNPATSSKFDKDNSILETLDSQTFGKVVVDGDTITFTGYYYNRETGELDVIGGNTLSANNIIDTATVIALCVVIPVVVIAAVVATLLVLKKKGKLGAKKK